MAGQQPQRLRVLDVLDERGELSPVEPLAQRHQIHERLFESLRAPAAICARGQREQSVACQDGQRLSETLMTGRQSTTKVIVVHRWQVIMNERVRMDHLHSTSGRQRNGVPTPASLGGRQNQ